MTAWIIIAVVIWPLIQIEKWIHKHVQGLGLLLTNDPQAAVLIYYLAFVPGVILHEASQWLLAQILRVEIKKFRLWPEKQSGTIRLGLVEIKKDTDMVRSTLIGIIPLISGILVIGLIVNANFSTQVDVLINSLATGELPTIFAGIGQFMSARDFWLWIYLIFAIANAMLPEQHDEINWWLILGVFGGIVVFLLILDLGILLEAGFDENGIFTKMGEWVSLALVMALILDLFMMGLIAFSEWLFSRLLNRELEYR